MTLFQWCNYFLAFAMILQLNEIPEGHSTVSQKVTMTEEQARDGNINEDVVCRAEIDRLEHQIFVHVTYSLMLRQECSRCLAEFKQRADGQFNVVLQDVNAPKQLGNENVDYLFNDRDPLVDIRQSLYEEIMINIPVKPLCREDCPGLAVEQKGEMLQQKASDPRWDALKKLKDKSI